MSIDRPFPGGLFCDDRPGEAVAETDDWHGSTMRHRMGRKHGGPAAQRGDCGDAPGDWVDRRNPGYSASPRAL